MFHKKKEETFSRRGGGLLDYFSASRGEYKRRRKRVFLAPGFRGRKMHDGGDTRWRGGISLLRFASSFSTAHENRPQLGTASTGEVKPCEKNHVAQVKRNAIQHNIAHRHRHTHTHAHKQLGSGDNGRKRKKTSTVHRAKWPGAQMSRTCVPHWFTQRSSISGRTKSRHLFSTCGTACVAIHGYCICAYIYYSKEGVWWRRK